MIIWLASYPRSGNTLLRTVFKNTFDIETYSDEKKPDQVWKETHNVVGHIEFDGEWSQVYKQMKNSNEVFYVKTHLPPLDDSPAIYIVRDGRMATVSYFHFMQKFFPEANRSTLDLILGNDYYEDWTTHYNHWKPEERKNTLLIKFEDIIHNSNEVIDKIEKFINFPRTRDWVNPFDKLNQTDPSFFRKGKTEWEHPSDWTKLHEMLFNKKHSDLMKQLGYSCNQDAMEKDISSNDIDEIVNFARSLLSEKKMFQVAAYERLELIEKMSKK
ncbi:sulfotransferase domain-containing protein [Campylobacterota bacterium]